MSVAVALLGSTGSIGTQTLDIVRARPERYRVVALGAARSVDALSRQAREFRPEVVALADPSLAAGLADRLPAGTSLLTGPEALATAAGLGDVVINGVVGFAGLPVTLAALQAGKRLGLANKESLVAAGPVVQRARATPGAEIVPVDSEHCAIHQCLRSVGAPSSTPTTSRTGGSAAAGDPVARIVLTASGGPFRGRTRAELEQVTIDDALAHPTWSMGPKVTIDSSTLMNKGLEVIEAHELFGIDYQRIEVVVHPQSIVHSMVAFSDGATMAQLSRPDMRHCIGYALAYPDRLDVAFGALDWTRPHRLDFEPPDLATFDCLGLAYAAGRAARTAPAWLNAANEVAVQAFLDGRIRWLDIAALLAESFERWPGSPASDAESVIAADREARKTTTGLLDRRWVA